MKFRFNRRDFLKLGGLLPLGFAAPKLLKTFGRTQLVQGGQENVLVVVFDAFSAYDISLYGYQRETMPNLARLADRAIVYHNHYAGCNFTTPGTASLLTGTLPWTHRAIQPNGKVAEPFVTQNIFGAFQNYYRIAYSHNGWVNTLLDQMQNSLDELVPWKQLFLRSLDGFIQTFFKKDTDIASVSWTRNVNIQEQGYAYSLFLSHLYQALLDYRVADIKKNFPRGIPSTGNTDSSFLLEDAINFTGNRLPAIPQPFAGYFHYLPPHGPYRTPLEFYNRFKGDGFVPLEKPEDVFTKKTSYPELVEKRTEYDEFILYVDREFGRLYDYLENSGLLENTWVVLTSDHGEMFERGIDGHSTDALYEPVVRIPLLIFEPGRTERLDVHAKTSAADVLPTLLHVTGHQVPEWVEGQVLPPYAEASPSPDRSVYVVRANKNDPFAPLTQASVALVKGKYKLLYYFGYEDRGVDELIKLYDVDADPEEMNDLYATQRDIADAMLAELKAKLEQVDQPYL